MVKTEFLSCFKVGLCEVVFWMFPTFFLIFRMIGISDICMVANLVFNNLFVQLKPGPRKLDDEQIRRMLQKRN